MKEEGSSVYEGSRESRLMLEALGFYTEFGMLFLVYLMKTRMRVNIMTMIIMTTMMATTVVIHISIATFLLIRYLGR